MLSFGASVAQKKPLQNGEKQNGIDPNDWKAVSDQRESPATGMFWTYGLIKSQAAENTI